MVTIEKLGITNDGENLIIKAKVREGEAYTNIGIDSIIIDTEDTFIDGAPSDHPVHTIPWDQSKTVDLTLNISSIQGLDSLKSHLIFVWIKTEGNLTEEVPCGQDKIYTLGVTLYMRNVYNDFMNGIKELENTCQIPQNMINQFLQWKAFTTAISTGHYTEGIKYYNKWFNSTHNPYIFKGCGCNGRISL